MENEYYKNVIKQEKAKIKFYIKDVYKDENIMNKIMTKYNVSV